jgi:hypothetical protein
MTERRERLVAGVASIAVTASMGALLLRAPQFRGADARADAAFEVVFVERGAAPKPAPRSRAHRRPTLARKPAAAIAAAGRDGPAAVAPAPPRPDLRVPDDAWAMPGRAPMFRSGDERLVHPPPARLQARVDKLHVRMKSPLTVEKILEEAGKTLGLWPPGYTDDPCPGINRLADYYRAHPEARDDLFQDALDLEARCRKAPHST